MKAVSLLFFCSGFEANINRRRALEGHPNRSTHYVAIVWLAGWAGRADAPALHRRRRRALCAGR